MRIISSSYRPLMLLGMFLLVSGVVFAQKTTLPADDPAMLQVSGLYKSFKTFAMLFTAICALIGGSRVYNKFAQGDPAASQSALTWFLTVFFCLSVTYFLDLYFR